MVAVVSPFSDRIKRVGTIKHRLIGWCKWWQPITEFVRDLRGRGNVRPYLCGRVSLVDFVKAVFEAANMW
jgi:hypothetical protein